MKYLSNSWPVKAWVCYRAVVPNGLTFFSVEYKIFIILAELLKSLPHVDLGLRYIEEEKILSTKMLP